MKNQKEKASYNSDITDRDKELLGERVEHIRSDKGRDDFLRNREKPVDFSGEDLDVPGRTLPKDRQDKLKDEENQLYSQGSGDNEDLEHSSDF